MCVVCKVFKLRHVLESEDFYFVFFKLLIKGISQCTVHVQIIPINTIYVHSQL